MLKPGGIWEFEIQQSVSTNGAALSPDFGGGTQNCWALAGVLAGFCAYFQCAHQLSDVLSKGRGLLGTTHEAMPPENRSKLGAPELFG